MGGQVTNTKQPIAREFHRGKQGTTQHSSNKGQLSRPVWPSDCLAVSDPPLPHSIGRRADYLLVAASVPSLEKDFLPPSSGVQARRTTPDRLFCRKEQQVNLAFPVFVHDRQRVLGFWTSACTLLPRIACCTGYIFIKYKGRPEPAVQRNLIQSHFGSSPPLHPYNPTSPITAYRLHQTRFSQTDGHACVHTHSFDPIGAQRIPDDTTPPAKQGKVKGTLQGSCPFFVAILSPILGRYISLPVHSAVPRTVPVHRR